MDAHWEGVPDDAWAATLRAAKEAELLRRTVMEAVEPMAVLGLDVEVVRRYVSEKRATMRVALRAHAIVEYGEERALAIHLYTVEHPFALYKLVNAEMHSTERGGGPGGVSERLRACLPYIKLLWVSLEELPPQFHFSGRVHRGVKWAFPTPEIHEPAQVGDHDPETYFYSGRELYWYDFKSSSKHFGVMYDDCFCGDRGPRTIFTIEGVKCYDIKIFSAVQREDEALFPPLSAFHVASSQKKLEPQHLQPGAGPGGFPDEVQLIAPPLREAIPAELKLVAGKEAIDFTAPVLGSGAFADVRGGTYVFPERPEPTAVAFKVFRGSQGLDEALRQQVVQEARVGLRLQHPHLIELFGILEIPEHGLSLVLELGEGGSLRSVLTDTAAHPDIPWAMRLRWLTEIAAGLQKLHSLSPRPLIHRDLKAGNVLLSSRDLSQAVAKVCDFGVAKFMQTMASRASAGGGAAGAGTAGTLPWKAPETFKDQYSPGSDMFAYGVTVFEVISRKYPFEGLGEPAIIEKTRARFEVQTAMLRFGITEEQQRQGWNEDHPLAERRPDLSAVEAGCPPVLLALMQRCWSDNPAERPAPGQSIAELQTLSPERSPVQPREPEIDPKVAQLMAMGFTRAACEDALKQKYHNVERALDLLLEQAEPEPAPSPASFVVEIQNYSELPPAAAALDIVKVVRVHSEPGLEAAFAAATISPKQPTDDAMRKLVDEYCIWNQKRRRENAQDDEEPWTEEPYRRGEFKGEGGNRWLQECAADAHSVEPRWMFHGTACSCIDANCSAPDCSICSIVQHGFQPGRARETTSSYKQYGAATWFAATPEACHEYGGRSRKPAPDGNGNIQAVVVAQVKLGRCLHASRRADYDASRSRPLAVPPSGYDTVKVTDAREILTADSDLRQWDWGYDIRGPVKPAHYLVHEADRMVPRYVVWYRETKEQSLHFEKSSRAGVVVVGGRDTCTMHTELHRPTHIGCIPVTSIPALPGGSHASKDFTDLGGDGSSKPVPFCKFHNAYHGCPHAESLESLGCDGSCPDCWNGQHKLCAHD